ncbi:MAG: hypothetical protein P1V20_17855 [Verrucomicrobiales bacterium]|nr:hypothetical protein [Verrucomicrobiales bacterium]
MNIYQKCIDAELNAGNLYETALDKFRDDPRAQLLCANLEVIKEDHRAAVVDLSAMITADDSTPRESEHIWQVLQANLRDSANLQGERSAVSLLAKAESYCQRVLQKLEARADIPEPVKDLVAGRLLPSIDAHTSVLSQAVVLTE